MALREKKKERTREALSAAAMRLVEEQGFAATTVDQIAESGGVSRRTFFRYFPSKEAALFPRQEERVAAFRTLLEVSDAETAFARVRQAFMALAKEYMEEREALVRQQEIIRSSSALLAYELQLDKDWENLVAMELAKDLPASETHLAEIQAGAVLGVIRATLRGWFEGKGERDLQRQGEDVFGMLEHGFISVS